MRSELLDRPPPERPLDAWYVDGLRPAGRGVRPEVCPPQATAPRPWARVLRDWLLSGWSASRAAETVTTTRSAPALEAVRQDFIDAVEGIPPAASDSLLDRIHFARSLRELWHLRAELFRLVALHRSQAEADERLSWLNRHFPTRAPRSGFGPLNPLPSKDMWP